MTLHLAQGVKGRGQVICFPTKGINTNTIAKSVLRVSVINSGGNIVFRVATSLGFDILLDKYII